MKALIPILIGLVVVGCGKKKTEETLEKQPTPKPTAETPKPPEAVPKILIADPIVEKAVRKQLKKTEDELTEPDLE
jgi:hypothetical protein